MTATDARPRSRPSHLTGLGHLLRLHLRRDRVRLVVWVLAFLVLVPASVAAMDAAYPDQASLQARAQLLDNPAAIMMTGPLFSVDNYTFGAMVANELSLWTILPAAIMGVLFTSRHTRAEEESGRLEMLRALPVGRYAAPAAAALLLLIAAALVGAAVAAGLVVTELAVDSSLAFGLATTLTTLVFGALTAVIAQTTESARATTGLGLAALALAFAIRGIGDVIDPQGSWLSWFSPLAWAQQTRLYTDLRWWPLLLSLAATVILTVVAVALSARRDLGASLRRPRPGRPHARAGLLSPAGLAFRLETPTIVWWTAGLFFFAVAFGMLASELEGMVAEMPTLTDFIEINVDDLTRSFGAVLLSMLAVGPVALATAGVLALRREESAGRIAGVLLTGSPRPRLLAGWWAVIAVEAFVMQVVLGFGLGLGMTVATGDGTWAGEMTIASLVYLPAVLLHGAVAVALFGLLPRWAPLAWVPVGWAAFVLFLGELLDLPDWARALSPLWHTPMVPDADVEPVPLLVLTALAVVLTLAGLVGFRRRDITEG